MVFEQLRQLTLQSCKVVRLNLDQFGVPRNVDDVAIDRDFEAIAWSRVMLLESGVQRGFTKSANQVIHLAGEAE